MEVRALSINTKLRFGHPEDIAMVRFEADVAEAMGRVEYRKRREDLYRRWVLEELDPAVRAAVTERLGEII